jgi:hypothetical protein
MAADPDRAGDARAYANGARNRAARMQRVADAAHARAIKINAEVRAARLRLDSLLGQHGTPVEDEIEEPED